VGVLNVNNVIVSNPFGLRNRGFSWAPVSLALPVSVIAAGRVRRRDIADRLQIASSRCQAVPHVDKLAAYGAAFAALRRSPHAGVDSTTSPNRGEM
jgi:hypothetical protein